MIIDKNKDNFGVKQVQKMGSVAYLYDAAVLVSNSTEAQNYLDRTVNLDCEGDPQRVVRCANSYYLSKISFFVFCFVFVYVGNC